MAKAPSIGWNLSANLFGQVWRALMALAFVPFYVRILGVEAYGLIGLYASLLLALGLLDAGLRPTLAREMARFTGGFMKAPEIRTLLRSIEWLLLGLAALIAGIMVIAAPWLAQHWVRPERLDDASVISAFQAMGLVAAAQFIESAYNSSLTGLQRQVLLNAIGTLTATLRGFGALAVLWIVPTLTAYFLWQAAVATLSVLLLGLAVYRHLPAADRAIGFSFAALGKVKRYALGMLAIAVLALLLTQTDRLLLARLMPLSELGRYTLAASLAGALGLIAGPIGNTFSPRLTQLREQQADTAFALALHRATRLVAVLVGGGAALMAGFGDTMLHLWLQDPGLAAAIAPVLALLALSALFNALTGMPYIVQLAHGVTGITLRINAAMIVLYVPVLAWAVLRWGMIGAAAAAAGLNLTGMALCALFTLRRYLPQEAAHWWLGGVVRPLLAVFGAALLLAWVLPVPATIPGQLAVLALAGMAVLGAGVASDPLLRGDALRLLGKIGAKPVGP